MTSLADRLRLAMAEKGASQVELARACKVKPPSVSGWLNVNSKFLRGENLLKAAKFLGVSPKWLAEGHGPMRIGDESAAEPLQEPTVSLRSALEALAEALAQDFSPAQRKTIAAAMVGLIENPGDADAIEEAFIHLKAQPRKAA